MQEPPWMPRTEEEYRQQVAEDAGPQPDELVRLQMDIDALLADNVRLREIVQGAWRFWAEMNESAVERMEDRGYLLLRFRKDAYQAFDALFRKD